MEIDTEKLAKLIQEEIKDIKRLPGCSGGEITIGRVGDIFVKIVTVLDEDDEEDDPTEKNNCITVPKKPRSR